MATSVGGPEARSQLGVGVVDESPPTASYDGSEDPEDEARA